MDLKKKVLLLITGDPRRNGRAAEGFRVADGLSLTEELEVSVLLSGAAAAAFAEPGGLSQDWVDGAHLLQHLVALKQRRVPLFLDGAARAALDEAGMKTAAPEQGAALRRDAAVTLEF